MTDAAKTAVNESTDERLNQETPLPGEAIAWVGALNFAAQKHRDQRRGDRQQTPYINHPIALVHCLALEGGITDLVTLMAALLHDTVEDTDTSLPELAQWFGTEVAAVVAEVTDDKSLPKAERKQLQIDHAPHLSAAAKRVKLADKICNLRDVHASPPPNWSIARRREYVAWAQRVVSALGPVNDRLEARFDEIYQTAWAALAQAADDPPLPRQIYLAGPLFSAAEQAFNRELATLIETNLSDHRVFLPQVACAGLEDSGEIFATCRRGLEESAIVVAILDGADADSGTCWECGYAAARQIPVVALRTDFRASGDTGGFNAMLYHGAAQVVAGGPDWGDIPPQGLRHRLLAALGRSLTRQEQ